MIGFNSLGWVSKFLHRAVPEEHHPKASLAIMITMILGLIPACKHAKASILMGVFISGLSFCRDDEVHHLFVSQFKRLLQVSECMFNYFPGRKSTLNLSFFTLLYLIVADENLLCGINRISSTNQRLWQYHRDFTRIIVYLGAEWKISCRVSSSEF